MKVKNNIKLGCALILSCLLTISEPVLAYKRTRQVNLSEPKLKMSRNRKSSLNSVTKHVARNGAVSGTVRSRYASGVDRSSASAVRSGAVRGSDRDIGAQFDHEGTVEGVIYVYDQYGSSVSGARIEISYPSLTEGTKMVSPGEKFTATYLIGPVVSQSYVSAHLISVPRGYEMPDNPDFLIEEREHGMFVHTFNVRKTGMTDSEIAYYNQQAEERKKQEEAKEKDLAELQKFKKQHEKLLAKNEATLQDEKEIKQALEEAKKHSSSANKDEWKKVIDKLEELDKKLQKLPVTLKITYVNAKGEKIASRDAVHKIGEEEDFSIPAKFNAELQAAKSYTLKLSKSLAKHKVGAEDDKKEFKVEVKLIVKASKIEANKAKYKTVVKYIAENGSLLKTDELMLAAKAKIDLVLPEGYKLQDARKSYHQAAIVEVLVERLEYPVQISYIDTKNQVLQKEKVKCKYGDKPELKYLQTKEAKDYKLADETFVLPFVKGPLDLQIKLKKVVDWGMIKPELTKQVKPYKAYTEDGKLAFTGKANKNGLADFEFNLPADYELVDAQNWLAGQGDRITVKLKKQAKHDADTSKDKDKDKVKDADKDKDKDKNDDNLQAKLSELEAKDKLIEQLKSELAKKTVQPKLSFNKQNLQAEPSKNSSLLKFLRSDNKQALSKIPLTILNQDNLKPHFTLIKGDYYYEPNGEITTVYTDENGELLLNNLPNGDYRFFFKGVEIAKLHIDNSLVDPGAEGSILVPSELLDKVDSMQDLCKQLSEKYDWLKKLQNGQGDNELRALLDAYNAQQDEKHKLTLEELQRALAEQKASLDNKYEVIKIGDTTYLKPKGADEEAMFKAYKVSKTGEQRSAINCLNCFKFLFGLRMFQ